MRQSHRNPAIRMKFNDNPRGYAKSHRREIGGFEMARQATLEQRAKLAAITNFRAKCAIPPNGERANVHRRDWEFHKDKQGPLLRS